jgi:hypothetical protein
MEKLSFKNFVVALNENELLLEEIKEILSSYDEEDLHYLGVYILVTFFDYLEEELFDVIFEVEDIIDIVKDLGVENYGIVLDLISYNPELDGSEDAEDYIMFDFSAEPDETEAASFLPSDAISEHMSKIFLSKHFKRAKKFFAKTKASLSKDKAKNRMNYIKKKAKIKRVLKMNKMYLQSYRRSRAAAIKSKKHIVQHHKGIRSDK